jgi:signal transduction histidine kinase
MQLQLEHHLRRASAAARGQAVGARTDVRGVIDDLARTLPRMYPDRDVIVEVEVAPDLQFRGERQDLEEMVGNLLDNAFKWGRRAVRAAGAPGEEPGRLVITVDDDGSGLPAERRSEVVARGIRLDEATPGAGLGLSIVDDLARAYGGRLELGESPMGGLRVSINLPAAGHRRVTSR